MSLKSIALAAASMLALSPAFAQNYPTIRNLNTAASGPEYWTPERMAAAKPKDLPSVSGAAHRLSAAAVPAAPGMPGIAGGTGEVSAAMQDELDYGTPQPLDGPYPGPSTTFTRVRGTDNPFGTYGSYPWRTVGRLFFSEPGGDFECSAATTYGGKALNIVWTAGHCVANGGHAQFYTNWLFCPAYKEGENVNFGCWKWAFASTTGQWFNNGAFSRDYAVVGMAATSDRLNENVANATGGLGLAWNWGRDQNWVHFGYPAQGPCPDGLQCVTLTEHRYDVIADVFGPPVNSFGSAQTPGASGSPIVLAFVNGNYINSDVSFFFSGGPNGNELGHELQGPYFDTTTCAFWKSWTGWPGVC